MTKKAIFPGTFDPFTIGHQSLVKRSLCIVDELIIAIGLNNNKKTLFSTDKRVQAIESLYKENSKVSIICYNSLTVDLAKKNDAQFIIRGIRSVNDFEYEKNIADINKKLTGIETLILFSEPEYAYISSSMVRELIHFGKDISPFVPTEITY